MHYPKRYLALAYVCLLWLPCTAWAGEVEVYANQQIKPKLIQLIGQAKKSVDVQMYTFTEQDVFRALQRADARGVQVRVFLDPSQPANRKNIHHLTARKIPIKWAPVRKPALMHRKLLIVDGEKALIGSANWTHNAFTRSYELDVLINDPEALQELQRIFNQDWHGGS